MRFRQVGAVMVPDTVPDEMGLGCPKCDDHEMIPISDAAAMTTRPEIQRFLKRHAGCGKLEQLERRGSRLGVVGDLDPSGTS